MVAAIACLAKEKPLVGISSGFEEGYRLCVSQAYAYSVERAGGIPVVLPLLKDSVVVEDVVARLDALVMTGGEDIDPARYGEPVWNETVEVNPVRDTSDLLILRAALRRGMPVLAICRGIQALAVCCGGSLYQDIPTQVEGTIGHSRGELEEPLHSISIDHSSRLYKMLGTDSVMVNSFHHQAARDGSLVLRVSAVAPDGVVEAIENETVLGVQFHPEKMIYYGDDTFLPIFQDLVSKAREF